MPIITAKPNIIIFNPSPIFFLRHCSPRIFLYLHTQTRSHSSFNTFCILVFRLHNQRATINYTCSFICIVLPIPSKLSHKCYVYSCELKQAHGLLLNSNQPVGSNCSSSVFHSFLQGAVIVHKALLITFTIPLSDTSTNGILEGQFKPLKSIIHFENGRL